MAADSNSKYAEYLDLPPATWKRPEGPLRVWRIFESRKKTADGEVQKFSIEEVPEELKGDIVDFMEKYFLSEEAMSVNLNLPGDPDGVKEFRSLWRYVLDEGLSVVAFKVNSDPKGKPVIAGVNVLGLMTPELEAHVGEMDDFRSEPLKKLITASMIVGHSADVWGKYGVDKYLSAAGLTVHPDFRRLGLAVELLRTRDDIGLAYQIPVSETVFTGLGSQIAASRAGFEVLFQKKYSEILDSEGKIMFPGIPVEYLKAMAKKLY